jgi:hypothetical protein
MAQAQLKIDHDLSGSDLAPASTFVPGTVHGPSPALTLQNELLARTAPVERWPIRQRVALILSASLGLWAAIIHLTVSVSHALA